MPIFQFLRVKARVGAGVEARWGPPQSDETANGLALRAGVGNQSD
ncbi:hypothetical protein VT84_34265 [Gemmata sp. SH-PL17]|nr:hypothetical protein VT84_34265 [Gemmata sp. SH-PL17]